jgi:hypothetical protein
MWITITLKTCAAYCSIAGKSCGSFLGGALDNPTPFDLGRGLLEQLRAFAVDQIICIRDTVLLPVSL